MDVPEVRTVPFLSAVTGETSGDEISIEYQRYWHVIPTGFSENRISALDATEPERSVTLSLEGLSTV